jgi:hypothetical protein
VIEINLKDTENIATLDEDMEDIEESFYEQLDEEEQEFIDLVADELEGLLCPHCIREKLAEVFIEGVNFGSRDSLSLIKDIIEDVLEVE